MTAEIKNRPPEFRGVVTGASSGIGRQIAIALARQASVHADPSADCPSKLVVHYRNNLEGARQTADTIEAFGVQTELVQADIRQPEDRVRLIDQTSEFLGAPTTWVNNAGADVLTGEIQSWSFAEKLRLLMETDVLGTIELSRVIVRRMVDQVENQKERGGLLVPPSMTFIGWDQAPQGMEGDAGQMFGPVKAAVMAFANSLAQEVGPEVRVNTVAPGWIKTAWGQTTDSYWDQRAKRQSLMDRWGTPSDVAKAVCFVADPSNTFCTGQTISVNGGWNRTLKKH